MMPYAILSRLSKVKTGILPGTTDWLGVVGQNLGSKYFIGNPAGVTGGGGCGAPKVFFDFSDESWLEDIIQFRNSTVLFGSS